MRRMTRAAVAVWWLTVLGAGVPAALVLVIGWPLPDHWPTRSEWTAFVEQPLTQTTMVDGFAILLWVLWALFIIGVIANLAGRLTSIRPRRILRFISPLRALSAGLVGGLVAGPAAATGTSTVVVAYTEQPGTSTSAAANPAGGAHRAATTPATPATPLAWTPARTVAALDQPGPPDPPTWIGDTANRHRVVRGDTLWDIARTELGDPQRWPEIFHLNQNKPQPNGYALHDPDDIHIGWWLALPARSNSSTPPNDPATPDGPKGHGREAPPPRHPAAPTPSAAAPSNPANPSRGEPSTATVPAPPMGRPHTPVGSPPTMPDRPQTGIDLGERGWVTAELATAVAAAAALAWIHRRRRYHPKPPGPAHRDDPDLTPLPGTIAALHDARPTPSTEDTMDEPAPQLQEAALATTIATLGNEAGRAVRLGDLPAQGVGLTGPGSISAGRGLLVSALSAGGPWAPATEASIVTTTADLARLLPDTRWQPVGIERLHVADTLGQALDELERQLLRRARLASQTADLTMLDDGEPDDVPPIVFLGTVPPGGLSARLAAILTIGARLAVLGVVLGNWSLGPIWHVNPDGTTTVNTVDGHTQPYGPRLNILDATASIDILDTVRQAHPIHDERPQPASEPSPAPRAAAAAMPRQTARQRTDPAVTSARRPLRLTVLGKPSIAAIDGGAETVLHIRRSAGIQILVHLAVNPAGATSDELMAILWPETRPYFARRSFHTTMHDLRQTLAEAIDPERGEAEPIPRTDERYHLDPNLVDIDLWMLNAAIDHAATAVQPGEHDAALRAIIADYTGPIAEGHSWLWLAPYREATRRHILDAHVALADSEPDARQALAIIQDAIRIEPYNEDLYQRAMRLHARLASPDGIRRTLRTLTEQFADLEVAVSQQSQQLATDLLERLTIRDRIRPAQ
jgi:DNA-binding SARP family transcriptional activator/LysM repeat protein